MDIQMAGIDYNHARLELREAFSFTRTALTEALGQFRQQYPQAECVLLSTCNRTELWISGAVDASPWEILCWLKGLDPNAYSGCFISLNGQDAVHYLMELGCGLKSQIFGEDQILTQLKNALVLAREQKAAGTVLEILFRDAITAAKKVKSAVRLTSVNRSMAAGTIKLLQQQMGTLSGRRCLVIGNGEMGRLAASALVEQGCDVVMTLRQYKTRDAVIPAGCRVVPYEQRIEYLRQADIVVSATLSPHYTLHGDQLMEQVFTHPIWLIDLAVPRDIDPNLRNHPQLNIRDVDDLGSSFREEDPIQIQRAEQILREQEEEFERWYYFRQWIPCVHKIGKTVGQDVAGRTQKQMRRLTESPEDYEELQKAVSSASQKAVEKLLYGLRDHLDREQIENCIHAFQLALKDS